MGLKTTNFRSTNLGITVPNAYAMIRSLNVDINGNCMAMFDIQQTRIAVANSAPLDTKILRLRVDKDQPLHRQVYFKAKEELFPEWEDDIIEESAETQV